MGAAGGRDTGGVGGDGGRGGSLGRLGWLGEGGRGWLADGYVLLSGWKFVGGGGYLMIMGQERWERKMGG